MQWIQGISPISFPALGIEINPATGFTIGALNVNFYGLLIAVGLLLAVAYAWKRSHEFGIKQDDITDGVLWIVPLAVVCARLYYCAFEWEQYAANPISILHIWEGGLAIYGGVIGAVVGIAIFCKFKKIKLAALLDLVALGFLIGQCIGRWGNFFNREAFGAQTDFFLRMGLNLTEDRSFSLQTLYYHPTFLYESLWNLIGFVGLHFLSKHRKYDGQIALGYAAWYGLGRTIIESLRTDSLYWGPFRVSQVLAAISCFGAAIVLCIQLYRKHNPENLFVHKVTAQLQTEEDNDEETEEAAEPASEEAPEQAPSEEETE